MGFCLLLKILAYMGKIRKYGQNPLDQLKKYVTEAAKTVSKKEVQKIAEATNGVIGNKVKDNITGIASTKPKFKEIPTDLE